jgi:hypothetical protein
LISSCQGFFWNQVLEQLLGPADVLVVELDADVAREAVVVGIGAGEAEELGLGNGHPLALEREVDGALLDDRIDVVAPRVVVDEDVHGQLVSLVQAARQAPDSARRLAVAGQEDAVVAAPELVLREAVPLGALLDEQDEVRRAAPDLDVRGPRAPTARAKRPTAGDRRRGRARTAPGWASSTRSMRLTIQ